MIQQYTSGYLFNGKKNIPNRYVPLRVHCSTVPNSPAGSSAGKESACNAGDPSLIPGLGRSAKEGIGYPLLYSWASLVAQLVKNLPAMRKIWVCSLGWEDPLEKERLPTPVYVT